jgi:PP-loop superfamily ATP-utilizing enzyme
VKNKFVLGLDNVLYQVDNWFPKLPKNSKVGVFFSGGMESSLITHIANSLYGDDNVELFYSDSMFSGNDPQIDENIRANVIRSAKLFDKKPHYVKTNIELLNKD